MLLSFDQKILEVLPLLLTCGKRTHDNITYYAHPVNVLDICAIDLFSLYILFSQYRSCDNTLEDCFFQISSYLRAYVSICTHLQMYNKGSNSPGTSIG